MGELGALIQEFRDNQLGVISDAEIGRQVGVTRGAIGAWIRGLSAMPAPEHLRALALYIRMPYDRVLQAALADAGYYGPRESDDGGNRPPTKMTVTRTHGVTVDLPRETGTAPRRRRGVPGA